MSELVKEPTDDEFSALLDGVAPNREQLPEENAEPPEVVEEPVAVETEPAVPDLPEKYQGKSAAEIARMHSELEQRLGQQGTELGELRRISAEMEQLKAQLNQAPPEPAPWETFQQGTDALDEAVLTNPKDTLDWIQQNQPQLYERALGTWSNIDPAGASRYDTATQIAALRSEYESQLAAVRAPVVASQNDAMLQTAYTNVANTNPLLATVAADIPGLLEANPEYKVLLGHGDIPTREKALTNLVKMAAFDRGIVAGQEPSADSTQAKKIAATVASPGSSAERPGEKTASQTLAERLLAPEGTSVADELARSRAAYAASRQAAR